MLLGSVVLVQEVGGIREVVGGRVGRGDAGIAGEGAGDGAHPGAELGGVETVDVEFYLGHKEGVGWRREEGAERERGRLQRKEGQKAGAVSTFSRKVLPKSGWVLTGWDLVLPKPGWVLTGRGDAITEPEMVLAEAERVLTGIEAVLRDEEEGSTSFRTAVSTRADAVAEAREVRRAAIRGNPDGRGGAELAVGRGGLGSHRRRVKTEDGGGGIGLSAALSVWKTGAGDLSDGPYFSRPQGLPWRRGMPYIHAR